MPTNFPTSVDNFTNPTANDSLNLPSHSTQHANANDAIEAVEDYLLNGGQGLTFLNKTDFTAQSTVNIDSLITSTYRNYKVLINVIGFNGTLRMQMRKAGVTTTAGYYAAGWGVDYAGSQTNQGLVNNGSNWIVGTVGAASNGNFTLDLLDAIAATGYTTFVGMTHYTGSAQTGFNGGAVPANVFTGLALSTSTGTMTGTIRIYGYRNS